MPRATLAVRVAALAVAQSVHNYDFILDKSVSLCYKLRMMAIGYPD
jgi:hypothetical protein